MEQGSSFPEPNVVPLLNPLESMEKQVTSEENLASSEDFIKVNVGGSSYLFKAATVKTRLPDTKLARFVQCSHDARLCLCDAYFMDSNEYYFERPPKLFDTIYKYYATGVLHRPLDVCEVEFYAELGFWRIPEGQISPCCWPRINQMADSMDDLTLNSKKRNGDTESLKERIYRFTEGDGSFPSTVFTFLSICFVLISVLGLILGSIHEFQVPIQKKGNISKRVIVTDKNESVYPTLQDATSPDVIWEPHPIFTYLETTCIIWFTAEYLLRFFVAPKKLSFALELLNIVDLIAIVPFYLEMGLFIFGFDSSSLSDIKGAFLVVRILRVLRVVRILKLGRYSSGMRTFALTLRSSARQLGMMGMVLCTGVVFFSTLIYYVEKDELGTPFTSIPAAFCGAIVSGVLVLALPITIIVDNFMKVSGNHQPGMFGNMQQAAPLSSFTKLDSRPDSPASKKPINNSAA
ncbi:hypothetical protein FO519_008362 [Halicephalobus sp. NKZ332]|nr:hypothetical protein FO519_008362 [Halicephalobus sp. NKZ332]